MANKARQQAHAQKPNINMRQTDKQQGGSLKQAGAAKQSQQGDRQRPSQGRSAR